jgi:hypothetical protein
LPPKVGFVIEVWYTLGMEQKGELKVESKKFCVIEGCGRKRTSAIGLCGAHTYRLRTSGVYGGEFRAKASNGTPRVGVEKCVLPNCERLQASKNLCRTHYNFLKNHGVLPTDKKCECGAPHYAKGLCNKHYLEKWRKTSANV